MLIVKEDIISRINNGDAKAFEQLYTTFYVYLCAVATKYVYNSEAAREIVNDVFMNVWNHHSALIHPVNAYGEFYQFNLSSCIRQQNSLTAQFVSFSLANLANIFYPPRFLQ